MAQQIYQKEKMKEKKEKKDFSSFNIDYIEDYISRNGRSGYHQRYSDTPFKNVDEYIKLCKQYRIDFNLKKMSKSDIDYTINLIKNENAKNILVHKKKKAKEDLFSMFIDENIGLFNVNTTINQRYKKEDLPLQENAWRKIFAPFEKNKKRFIKALNSKQVSFLVRMATNEDKWVRDPSDFVFKSKNLNQSISEYCSFVLWEYPTTEMERLLFINDDTFKSFFETKSFIKTIKSFNNDFKLTKKQINQFKDYKPFIDNESIFKAKKEFFIFDIIADKNVTKDLFNQIYSSIFVEYCHYVKTRIFEDDFFDHQQIRPVFDYVQEQVRQVAQAQTQARAEANDYKINFYYHLNHHEPYTLLEGMQEWHKTLHKSKIVDIKKWDKSETIKEWKVEKFRNIENEADKYKHQNFSLEAIVELNTSAELSSEGRNMKHCVSSYSRSCANGNSRIFSLRKKPFSNHFVKSYATIQVKNDDTIIQALSFKNDPLTIEDKNIISKWANENNLKWN